jgi:hypothetical protein
MSSPALPFAALVPVILGALGSCLAVSTVLGLGVGGVLAVTRVNTLKQTVASSKKALPHHVAASPELSEALLTLVRYAKRPNRAAFASLTSKINSMVQIAIDLAAADPSSVEESMVSVGTHMFDSVCSRLQAFYTESDVMTVRSRFEMLGVPTLPDNYQTAADGQGSVTSTAANTNSSKKRRTGMSRKDKRDSAERMAVDGMVGSGTLEPLQRDMRAAHHTLMEILSDLAVVMAETARDKVVTAVVGKYA